MAAALIRAGGLDAFSMRKLGAALGVNPMTIYLRFENKDELLAAVAERLLGRLELPDAEGGWVDRVVALAAAIRSHLIETRDVLVLLGASDGLGLAMLDATEAGLTLMEEAGFEGDDAVAAFRVVFWHAVGAAMAHDAIAADQVDVIRAADAASMVRSHPRFAALVDHFTTPDPDTIFMTTTRALALGLAAGEEGPRHGRHR